MAAPHKPEPAPKPGASVTQLRQHRAAAVVIDPKRVVEKEDRLDATANGGFVRGGRVRDPVLRMFRTEVISKLQWDAVELFRDDVALANGARINQVDSAGVRSPTQGALWPAEARLAAMRRVNRTWQRLTDEQARISNWVIIEHRTLDDYASHQHIRRERASALFHEALAVFTQRYRGMVRL